MKRYKSKEEATAKAKKMRMELCEEGCEVHRIKTDREHVWFKYRPLDGREGFRYFYYKDVPEYPVGTFGKFWDDDEDKDEPVYDHLKGINLDEGFKYMRSTGSRWKHFEPFYINDPILERAIQLMAKALKDRVINSRTEQESIDFYLSQAKKELNK